MITQGIRYRIDKDPGVAQISVHGNVDLVHSKHNHIGLGYPYLIHQHTQSDLEDA